MFSDFFKAATILLLLFTFEGCSPALYKPTHSDAQRTGIAMETLLQGRDAYVNKCAGCHMLSKPEQFTEKQWGKILPDMLEKANCNEKEVNLINNYIKARAKKE